MQDTPNFSSVLDHQPAGVDRPKPLPVGTYSCVVKGLPRFDKSSKKGTDFVEFTLQPIETLDDVDEDDLTAALTKPSGQKISLADKTIRATFYLTEDAAWRLDKFLTDLGFELGGDRSRRDIINETPNCSVLVSLRHRPSEDDQVIYAEVSKTAPAA